MAAQQMGRYLTNLQQDKKMSSFEELPGKNQVEVENLRLVNQAVSSGNVAADNYNLNKSSSCTKRSNDEDMTK